MQITGSVTLLLREKNPDISSIGPNATVYEAIELMANRNIGALPVVEAGRLVGMLSERDYTRKVVLRGRASKDTPVGEIMTRNPIVVSPDNTVGECMEIMTDERVRHLPVVENGELLGILSIGDLVKWIISAQTATIDQLTSYVFGVQEA
ncbi:MAG: CBS domain-containing protein [Chthoniobacteraceae bacterium]